VLESLEDRKLLATSTGTFTPPSLTGLITQAFEGKDTSQATIKTMLKALQSQLTSGPLADLNAGTVDGNGFVVEVQDLVSSYQQNVDQQLLPHFKNIDELLKLQGAAVLADVTAFNQENTVGLIDGAGLSTESQASINALTAGPIFSLGTPLSAYVARTQNFESELNTILQNIGSTSSGAPSIADLGTTLLSDSQAYLADMYVGLQVTHPNMANSINQAVMTLQIAESAFDQTNATNAQAQLKAAINVFDAAILGSSGLLASQGVAVLVNAQFGYIPHNLTVSRAQTTVDAVSGTGTSGGTATLTATLDTAAGTPLGNQTLSFTLDGVFAGTAITDSTGVATLTGVPTSDAVGTTTGAIYVTFASSLGNNTSAGTGDIVVSQSNSTTTLTSSVNPSVFGQSVTFTATVAAGAAGSGTPTGTVTFKDGTTTLGTGTLNSSGVATFNTSSLSVGTHSTITAVYSGDANFTTSTSTAVSQVVNQASTTTTVASTLNPSTSGASVTFTATVAANSPGTGTPAGTVTFMDGTTALGSGPVTLSGGVATLPIATLTAGTHLITAVYSGDTNFATSTSTALTQTVNQAPAITSASSAQFPTGTANNFTVTTTGFPDPALSVTPTTLPTGVTFTDNHNGTATIASTTAATASTTTLTITANNGVNPNATQMFTLEVAANAAPTITSADTTTFTHGTAGSFTVTTTGFPDPALSESGALPTGVTFTDNHNGTATLASTTAAVAGQTVIMITANNGITPNGTQTFTLTIS
jgi:hypothetical protein